jgi:hypothetical protein
VLAVQVQHLLVILGHKGPVQHLAHLPQPQEVGAVAHIKITELVQQVDLAVVVAVASAEAMLPGPVPWARGTQVVLVKPMPIGLVAAAEVAAVLETSPT